MYINCNENEFGLGIFGLDYSESEHLITELKMDVKLGKNIFQCRKITSLNIMSL